MGQGQISKSWHKRIVRIENNWHQCNNRNKNRKKDKDKNKNKNKDKDKNKDE
jgi:hypothetical protein